MFQFNYSFVSLENRIVNSFGWINYKRDKDELSNIAQQILQYKFKQEALEIYSGADTRKNLTYAQWEERCKKLLYTFFTRAGESSGIILFPDIEITLISQGCQNEIWQRPMMTLHEWCKTSCLKDATGLIIRNYDLKNHVHFCGITNDELVAFKDSKNLFSFQESNKRILAFNPSLKVIFIIRLVELQDGESQLLKEEVDYCIDEVNLLCFLLKDELANTGVIVTGLVAYSGENVHIQSGCKDCSNIVSFKIFDSVKIFKGFWEIFVTEKNFEGLAIDLALSEKKEKNYVFQAVASKIVGYLAHLQFIMLERPILPLKKNNPAGDIKQAELLLDRYQMKIAYSDDKRVWLEGNYGTGKTVVALKKLELLCEGLKDKEVIYYVNFASKSPLDFVIKQRFEKNENIKAIKGKFSLSNTINLQILPKEGELGTKNVHLIVDEYGVQDLFMEEANSLGQIFKKEEQFTNSTVLIAAQPIEINRVDNFYENGVKRQFSQKKHELDKLMQIMGMKKKTLGNVMRTTVQINILGEITQAYLNNQSNQYVRFQSGFPSTSSKLPQNSSLNLSSNVSNVSSDSSKSSRARPPFQSHEVTYPDLDRTKSKKMDFKSSFHSTNPKQSSFSFQSTSSKPSSLVSVLSGDSSNPAASSPPFQSQIVTADYYQLQKLIPTAAIPTNLKDRISYQETVTKYRYTCESQIGHGIIGPLPKLIKLRVASTDKFQQIALMASVLEKIIPAGRTVVIHFESDDPPHWLKSLFELTNWLTMTTNTKEFLTDKSKNLVLVKNLSFLKGLEFSDVLLILDSNEYHLRQYIPEAIARCKSNLSVLIKPKSIREAESIRKVDSVVGLVDEWKRSNQDEPVIDILEIGFCSKTSCNGMRYHRSVYCIDEKFMRSSYKVHENNKQYQNFLTEIKRTYNQDIQANYAKKSAEAKAK